MAADGSSVPPCAPQPNTPQHHPDDAKDRLERALGRLGELYDEMATRHALLSSGMARADGLRQTMIAQLDALDGDPDLEPSLAHPEFSERHNPYIMARRRPGATDDREEQCEDEGAETGDCEPMLGRTEVIDQTRQQIGQDDLEPSFGAQPGCNQLNWTAGYDAADSEREEEHETDGNDDREPDHDHEMAPPDDATLRAFIEEPVSAERGPKFAKPPAPASNVVTIFGESFR
jgi:hypothetical protein